MKWLFPFWLIVLLYRFSDAAVPRYYSVLRSFGFAEQSVGSPVGEICLGTDGRFYGQAIEGSEGTTIFSIAKDGSNIRILYRGDVGRPGGGLIEATDGLLYGFSSRGLFSLKKDGGEFRQWDQRDVAWDPAKLLEGSNGFLYGTSGLHVFRVAKDGTGFQILHQFRDAWFFDGLGDLIELDGGDLAGIVNERVGGIYRMKLDGSDYRVIREFSVSTNSPGPVYLPTTGVSLVDGRLFGSVTDVTTGGFRIFSMATDGSDFRILHALGEFPGNGFVKGAGGKIYGSLGYHDAKIFEMDLDGGNYKETVMRDEANGMAIATTGGLVAVGDNLYGLATDNESNTSAGYFYEFRPGADAHVNVLKRLWNTGGDGALPNALVYSSEGTLYGTCLYGGEIGHGTIWKMAEDGSGYRVLRHFEIKRDGGRPMALMEGTGGWLYGLAQPTPYYIDSPYHQEYPPSSGNVFRILKTGEGFEVLRSHAIEWPSSLLAGKDGRIYVTVSRGNTATNQGAYVYSIRSDGGDYKELVKFLPDETVRLGQLLEASDGNFYVSADTKIFRITKSGEKTMLHDERAYPAPHVLMEGADGGIYGSNVGEGFFRINKDGTGYVAILDSSGPRNFIGKRMVQDEDGKFLGINDHTMFRVGPTDEYPGLLRSFSPWQMKWGGTPTFGLVKGTNGVIFGLTDVGGGMGLGTVFRLGAWTEAPELALSVTNATNLTVTVRGSLGTRFQLEGARSPDGPWKDEYYGGYVDLGGGKVWPTASTNTFFRWRLMEY